MAEELLKTIREHDEGRTLHLKLTRKDIIETNIKQLNINFKEIDKKNRGIISDKKHSLDYENIFEKKTKRKCCYCCCNIPSNIFMYYIPVSYDHKEFVVRPQHFCSYDCASSFCDKELRGESSAKCMLTIYHKKFSDCDIEDYSLNVPPPFKYLEEFGGQYSETEFRSKFIKNVITMHDAKNKGGDIKISIIKTYQRISDSYSCNHPEISFGDLYDKLLMENELEKIANGTSKFVMCEYDFKKDDIASLLPSEQRKKNEQTYEERIYKEEEQRLIDEGKLCKREIFLLKDIVDILTVKKQEKKRKKEKKEKRKKTKKSVPT